MIFKMWHTHKYEMTCGCVVENKHRDHWTRTAANSWNIYVFMFVLTLMMIHTKCNAGLRNLNSIRISSKSNWLIKFILIWKSARIKQLYLFYIASYLFPNRFWTSHNSYTFLFWLSLFSLFLLEGLFKIIEFIFAVHVRYGMCHLLTSHF